MAACLVVLCLERVDGGSIEGTGLKDVREDIIEQLATREVTSATQLHIRLRVGGWKKDGYWGWLKLR
jgi:hypothetical protein